MKKLIIAISVLAGLGAAVAVLVGVALPTPAEFILTRAARQTAELTSVHVAGTVTTMNARGPLRDDQISAYTMLRGMAMPEARRIAAASPDFTPLNERLVFEADADLTAFALLAMNVRGAVDAPQREPVAGDIRLASGKVFFRYTQVPREGRSATPGFVGTWYDFLLTPPLTERPKNGAPTFFAYTPEEERAWRNALAAARFLRPLGALGTGEVGGRKAWVIPVRVDGEAKIAWERQQDAIFGVPSHPEAPAAREMAERWHGDIAVDRATNQILAVTMTNVAPNASPGPETSTWRLSFSKHNEPVEIAAPERVESIMRFDTDAPPALASSGLAGSRPAGAASSTPVDLAPAAATAASSTLSGPDDDQDDDNLPDVLEQFYGSDAFDPDSDQDGMTDGAEVDAGRDPLGPGLLYDFRAS